MKIKEVDKETKNTNKKYILPIAQAGLSLGITAVLIKTGAIDYDAMLNWENVSDIINDIDIIKLPGFDINNVYNVLKSGITVLGMNTIVMVGKGFNFAKEVIKPIMENDKVKNNPTILKIKEVLKGKNKENNEEQKKPKALVNLAKNGLALGFKAYLLASGQIDYNSVYDFSKLPHKFANIAQIAKSIDLNKLKIGMESLKIIPQFISERKQEKKEGMSLISRITFKDILQKISKEIPSFANTSNLTYVKNMIPKDKIIQKEGDVREC